MTYQNETNEIDTQQTNRHLALIIRGFCQVALSQTEDNQDGFEDTVGMLIHDQFRRMGVPIEQCETATEEWVATAVGWYF